MTAWRSEDQESLQKALQEHGLDETSFARSAAISLGQLRELLQGGAGQFYSESIKAHVGLKLLRRLGIEPSPQPVSEQLVPEAPHDTEALPVIAVTQSQPSVAAMPAMATGSITARVTPKVKISTVGLVLGACGLTLAGLTLGPWRSTGGPLGNPQDPAASLQLAQAVPTVREVTQTDTASRSQAPTAATAVASATTFPPTPAPQKVVMDTAASVSATCDWALASESPSFKTDGPTKVGNYVHFVAERSTTICVVDQSRKVTQLQLNEGEARSVYGEGPFLVHLEQNTAVQLFFQGRRVPKPQAPGYLVLQPAPLG